MPSRPDSSDPRDIDRLRGGLDQLSSVAPALRPNRGIWVPGTVRAVSFLRFC